MSFLTLRFVVRMMAIVVWIRHFSGAAQAFTRVEGERPPRTIQLFPLAIGALVYTTFNAPLEQRLIVPAVALLVLSLVLFEWARKSIRGHFFSWIYSNDTPEFLWASGPFAHIRNPFYASYMMSYIAVAMVFPAWLSVGVVVAMGVYFYLAARHEEKKFERSPIATEYSAYFKRTGRFLPKLR